MGKAAAIGNDHNPYRLIRNIDPRKPRVREVIRESDCTLIHFQGSRLVCWADEFEERFSWPTVIVRFPVIPGIEPMEVDNRSPLEIEIIRKTDFMKGHETSGSDGLSICFLQSGGEMLTVKLPKLQGSIWVRAEISED